MNTTIKIGMVICAYADSSLTHPIMWAHAYMNDAETYDDVLTRVLPVCEWDLVTYHANHVIVRTPVHTCEDGHLYLHMVWGAGAMAATELVKFMTLPFTPVGWDMISTLREAGISLDTK